MIECFKTGLEGTKRIDEYESGCWINVVAPTPDEKNWLKEELGIVSEFIRSAVDEEESPHTDHDDDTGQVMVIIDCASVEDERDLVDKSIVQYDTQPLSILMVPEHKLIVTVSLHPNATVTYFTQKRLRDIDTRQRTRLLLQMLLHITQQYLIYLRSIHRQFTKNERELHATMRNKELIKMLGFEKSLVYFSTSLKADEAVLTKIRAGRLVALYDDDQDLIEDIFIEIHQAIEMCTIYSKMLNGTMETFGSVISNNLNLTMRTLTAMALILAIPTIVFSFYGMNVSGLPSTGSPVAPLIGAIAACALAGLILWRTRFFR